MSIIQSSYIRFKSDDIKKFCELTNDPNLIHTDIETAKQNGFKSLVVNGALSYAVSIGILMRSIKDRNGVLILKTSSEYKKIVESNIQYEIQIELIDTYLDGTIEDYSLKICKANEKGKVQAHHIHTIRLKYASIRKIG